MSEPVLRLEPERVSVEPGGQVTVVLTVYNPGQRVEGYDLDVVGRTPLPWATVTPASVSVYPQQEESAVVTFAPPSGPSAPGGSVPFGVRARSQLDPQDSAVAEGDLDVGSVSGLQATLAPVTSSGRWSGRHTVTISNWGNADARLRLTATDPDERLGFLLAPPVLDVPLGGKAVARLKVRTRHPELRGTVQRLPFQVVGEPDLPEDLGVPRLTMATPERPVVDGAFNQKPILSRLVVAAAALLLIGLIALVAWLLMRDDPPPPEESAGVPPPPAALRAVGNTSPDTVILEWEPVDDIDGYTISPINPDSGAVGPAQAVDDADATTVGIELPAETRLCFQIRAVRGDLRSEATPGPTDVCDETEAAGVDEVLPPGVEEPEVTVSPDVEGDLDGGGEATGENGGNGNGDGEAPRQFIAVLSPFGLDLEDDATAALAEFVALGVPAKLLSTEKYGLVAGTGASPTPTPVGTTTPTAPTTTSPSLEFLYVYVDGEDAVEAAAACAQAVATIETAGETPPVNACLLGFEVVERPEGETPPGSPGPTSPTP